MELSQKCLPKETGTGVRSWPFWSNTLTALI